MTVRASSGTMRASWPTAICGAGAVLLLALVSSQASFADTTKADADALLAKGQQLYQREDFPGARAPLEQALAAYRRLGLGKEEADTLHLLGNLSLNLAQYDKAQSYYEQAFAAFRKLGQEKEAADTLNNLGVVAYGLGRYEQALDYYEQARAVYHRLGLEKDEADAGVNLGALASSLAQHEKALGYYEQALAIYHKLGLAKEEATATFNLGVVAYGLTQYDKALKYYRRALAAFQKLGLEREAAAALNGLGAVAAGRTQYDEALGYYQQALATYRKLGMEREAAGTLNDLGEAARERAQYDQAVSYYQQALETYRKLGLEKEAADTLGNLGLVAQARAQYDQAASNCQQALATYRKLGLEQEVAATFGNLASVAEDQGRYDEAADYYDQALATVRKLGLERAEAADLQGLGVVAYRRGRYDEALRSFQQARETYHRFGLPKEEAYALNSLGSVAADLARYSEALSYFEQAVAIFRKLGQEREAAVMLNNLGAVASQLAQYDKARGGYQQAVATFRRLGQEREAAEALNNLGFVAAQLLEYDEALGDYQRALATFLRLGVPDEIGLAELNIADLHLSQGRLGDARAILEKQPDSLRWGRYYLLSGDPAQAAGRFEEAAKGMGEVSGRIACQTGLGLAREALGECDQAVAAYTKAVELIEEARANTPAAQRGSFFEAKDCGFRRLEPYEGLVRVLHRLGRDDEAFYWSEHTKARALVEAMARAPFGTPLGLPVELRNREDDLTNQVAALSKRAEEKPEQRAAIEEQVKPLREKLDALIARLRMEYPEYASLRYPQPLHAGELALGPQEVLLAFEVTESETLAFLVREGRVDRVFEIKQTRQDLTSKIVQYRTGLAGVRQQADLRALDLALGQELFQLLLAPATAEVKPHEHMVVVPDGAIGLLPLEVLVESTAQAHWADSDHGPYPEGVRYVGDGRTFTYWQSATAMTTVRRLRKQVGGDRVLAVADPVFEVNDPRVQQITVANVEDDQLPLRAEITQSLRSAYGEAVFRRLAGAGELVEKLRRLYGARLTTLVGLEARKARLKQEPLDVYSGLIFATHGVLGANVPWLRQPALVLSQVGNRPGENGYLTMAEVMDLKLRAELVALMACNTGAGKFVGGEGVMAMGRAFQYAGARSVLSSLWEAEDASTNLLTEVFLEQLAAGQDKAQALQTARQRLREAGYVHPFYWAGFVLIGERGVASREQGQVPAETRD